MHGPAWMNSASAPVTISAVREIEKWDPGKTGFFKTPFFVGF